VAVLRLLRTHLDSVMAIVLLTAYLGWIAFVDDGGPGEPLVQTAAFDETVVILVSSLFLLALALRSRLPLVPLALACAALFVAGRSSLGDSPIVAAGVLLTSYSVAAWSSGRAALVGALVVGSLAGLEVLRSTGATPLPREAALPAALIVGSWALGLAMRSIRAERGDERVIGGAGWESGLDVGGDPVARDALVRDLRDLIEGSMSTVILRSRAARASISRDPARAERALAAIEAAGTEALQETQRLTGLLLSPDGAALAIASVGLRDLDELAVAVTDAGLPVTTRVEGQPVPLSPDLDAAAYRVVHAALLNALDGTTDGEAGVVVRYGRDELQVEVVDDGVPLEDGDAGQGATGLMAARDEVAALGGTLDAGPGEERGYWVLARLPYEPEDLD
jgi:signal transduction histidine kinase